MGHRTTNDEMMRVPRDLADYVRSQAPERGLTYMAFMREMVFAHIEWDEAQREPVKPKKKVAKVKHALAAAVLPEPLPPKDTPTA